MRLNNRFARPCPKTRPPSWLGLTVALFLAGCATVEPWQKGKLAQPGMALDFDALTARQSQQVFQSKEAARGGDTAAGGGCGCN